MIIADDGPLRARLGRVAQLNTRVISLDPESKVAGNPARRLSHVDAGPEDDDKIHATVKRLEEQESVRRSARNHSIVCRTLRRQALRPGMTEPSSLTGRVSPRCSGTSPIAVAPRSTFAAH